MSKTNKKSINYGLKILAILAFALIFIPFSEAAAAPVYVGGHDNPDGTYTFGDFVWGNSTSTNGTSNGTLSLNSISPKSANIGENAKTITIFGNGFTPNSVAKVNGSNRPTTFIDYSHLLVQLNGNDMYQADGFYITVFNPISGEYSNSAFFTVNNGATSATTNTNGNNNGYNNNSQDTASSNTTTSNTTDKNFSNLTSNAIWGSNGFLPSGLVQWIILAIIILLIVILARKIFGSAEEYHESPMKHA